MKIDPYHYPVIIIAAFVIGVILAMVFGFRPQHGVNEAHGRGILSPALVQTLEPWTVDNA